jgi:amidophosphoribosyltransferase
MEDKTMNQEWMSDDKPHEECGVFGIYNNDGYDVQNIVYYGLYALQHRGQESAGIAVVDDNKRVRCHKEMGLVAEAIGADDLKRLGNGKIAIGHVRYSTTGASFIQNAQPLVMTYKNGTIALGHNGNLINADTIRAKLEEEGALFQTTLDTEVMANLIARNDKGNLEEAIENMMGMVKGSYSLVMAVGDKLIGVRDPNGIRPLVLGRMGESYLFASESCAFDAVGAEFVRDVSPGEIVVIGKEGVKSKRIQAPLQSSMCVFEFVYFSRTDSVMDGISVYDARRRAGKILAKEHPIEADLVIGVPDSGITAALGYSERSGIPFGEGLIKNRYVGRTFIQPNQHLRDQGVLIKLNALRHIVKGKRIIMVDDSIVRGTTSKKIVAMLRTAGAREVHFRISSPPVQYSCHFGIDTPNRDKLLAANNTIEEMAQYIGVDTLGFISVEGLLRSVEGSGCGFCTACFSGEYPMEVELDRKKMVFGDEEE